jgi:hypothetical protein
MDSHANLWCTHRELVDAPGLGASVGVEAPKAPLNEKVGVPIDQLATLATAFVGSVVVEAKLAVTMTADGMHACRGAATMGVRQCGTCYAAKGRIQIEAD